MKLRTPMRTRLELERLECRTLLASGALDPAFGQGGKVTIDFDGPQAAHAESVVVQADGKVVVGGVAFNSGSGHGDFALARYNTDGNLDASFGQGGRVLTSMGRPTDIHGIALQADGKIVAAGLYITSQGTADTALARYNSDGTLDGTFGQGGLLTPDRARFGGVADDIVVQPDGKLVVSGALSTPVSVSAPNNGFILARYNADGSPDAAFGKGGRTTLPFAYAGATKRVALEPDGKIVVAGGAERVLGDGSAVVVLRYLADGSSLDTSFGANGTVSLYFGGPSQAGGVAVQADGKVVVGGSVVGGSFGVYRLNVNGTRDTSFGQGGLATGAAGLARDLVLAADGKIVETGETAVARYNADGTLDTSFGGTGSVPLLFAGLAGHGRGVAVLPGGAVVVAGYTQGERSPDGPMTVNRYTAAGNLDASFATGGTAVTPFAAPVDVGGYLYTSSTQVAVAADGKVVAVSSSQTGGFVTDFDVARTNPDGTLDATFGAGGRVTTDLGGDDRPSDVVLQPDGKIVVAGMSARTLGARLAYAFVRYNADGSLDTSFGQGGTVVTLYGDSGGSAEIDGLALQPDGKIIGVGWYNPGASVFDQAMLLVRLNSDGSVDQQTTVSYPSFGTTGKAVAVQPDGRIVVAGYVLGRNSLNSDALVARFLPDFSPDPSFDSDGRRAVDLGGDDDARELVLLPDGKIVVAGRYTAPAAQTSSGLAVARFNTDGSSDTSFGAGGKALVGLDTPYATFGGGSMGLAVLADGKAIVGTATQGDVALARLTAFGQLDLTWGPGGIVRTDFGGPGAEQATDLAAAPGGKVVAGGFASNYRNSRIALARYLTEPSPNVPYVTHLYQDLLGRSPDAVGVLFWSSALDAGTPRAQVVSAFLNTDEYRTHVVSGLYMTILHRAVDDNGIDTYVPALRRGVTVEQSKALLLGSFEYFQKHGATNDGFLAGLYQDVLGRPIDATGRRVFGQALTAGATREAVALAVLTGREAYQNLVGGLYVQFLRRPADPGGLQTFTDALQHGARDEAVISALVESDEYFNRAGV